jgi:secondary thiamine-phosphate synthase enzyme
MQYINELRTHKRNEFLDITDEVRSLIVAKNVKSGVCHIFVPHTTAAVTINENIDSDVTADMISCLNKNIDTKCHYQHAGGNSPAHIKASILGSSLTVFIESGELVLGTWQGIYFCEFDGPRPRKYIVKIISDD